MNAPGPDGLLAVAALQRCLQRRDYAGAARLVTQKAVLDGLTGLAAPAWRSAAEQAYQESVAEWRADHEATLRMLQERDVAELVAGAVLEHDREARRDAASSGWPVSRRAA